MQILIFEHSVKVLKNVRGAYLAVILITVKSNFEKNCPLLAEILNLKNRDIHNNTHGALYVPLAFKAQITKLN